MVMEEDNYMGRHLLATAEESNATIVNTTCVLMYLEQLSLVISPVDAGDKPEKAILNLPKLENVEATCGSDSAR